MLNSLFYYYLGVSDNAKDSMIEPIIPTTFAIANNQASIINDFIDGCANYHEVIKNRASNQ